MCMIVGFLFILNPGDRNLGRFPKAQRKIKTLLTGLRPVNVLSVDIQYYLATPVALNFIRHCSHLLNVLLQE